MRWDGLFADLEAQLAHAVWRQTEVDAAEMTRGESAAIHLSDRLRGSMGERLALRLTGSARVEMHVSTVGPSWIGGTDSAGGLLVPMDSVIAVDAALPRVAPERSASARALGIGSVYRSMSRARVPVSVLGHDGILLAEGTIDRVGADHLDISTHARDEARRARAIRGIVVVPLRAIGFVRSAQTSDF